MRTRVIPFLIFCIYGGMPDGAHAAQNLPPLAIDPALLGGAQPAPAAAPSAEPPSPGEAPPRQADSPAAAVVTQPTASPSTQVPAAPAAPRSMFDAPAAKSAPAQTAPAPAAQPAAPAAPAPASEIKPEQAKAPAPAPAPKRGAPARKEQAAPPPREAAAPAESSAAPALAEGDPFPPPALAPSGEFKGLLPLGSGAEPTFFTADKVTGMGENQTVAEGSVVVKKRDVTLTADKVTYWQLEDEAEAEGSVTFTRAGDRVTGPKAHVRLSDSIGWFEQPQYSIKRNADPARRRAATTGSGQAERADLEGENHYRFKDATYSTCEAPDPDWYFKAGEMELDYDREEGEAYNAKMYFKGVPIFYLPYGGFPLNNNRRSGVLPPTFGVNNRVGLDLTVPYYLNLAPNYDATIAPRLLSRRGLQLGGEFRYLSTNSNGILRGEVLPSDRVTGDTRSAYSFQHNQSILPGLTGALDLNGVSDDRYFTDLSTRLAITSQTYLVRQGTLNYAADWWNASALVQRYQTLQDVTGSRIAEPYRRLPQLTLTALKPDIYGAQFDFKGEYVNFKNPDETLAEGQRTLLYPQISFPFQTPAFYVTPKIGAHWTHYSVDRRQSAAPANPEGTITRTLPIMSVDSGMTFERESEWFGRSAIQTLEPRVYYLRVPAKNQDNIPVFDTAALDFNFAQIFSENLYSGPDRIADANQITAAVTSRYIDSESGAEMLRAALGQRYYFRDQTVGLPGQVLRTEKSADLLAALSGQLLPKTYLDSAVQYNPRDNRTERYNIGVRYQPEYAKVFNISYRFLNDRAPTASLYTDSSGARQSIGLRDLDMSTQWPLWGKWYGVGRYNYSLRQQRLIEAIAGVEYNAGCWVLRAVGQRFAAGSQGTTAVGVDPSRPTSYTTAFFLQLEFNGFSSIGSNPIDLLRRNISGYGKINSPLADPVFGSTSPTPYTN